MPNDDGLESALSGIDAAKRKTLARLITGTAFVAPILASVAIDSLTIAKAQVPDAFTSAVGLARVQLR